MQVVLVMFRADGERRSFSVYRDMTVIGRREDCDLRIPLGEVSRKHCRVIKDGESVRLEDLGSSNGTFHNGQRVQEAMLGPGDTVQIGPVTFMVQIDGVPADEEMQAGTQAGQPAADFTPVEDHQQERAEDVPAAELTQANGDSAAQFNVEAEQGPGESAAPNDDLVEFNFDEQQPSQDHPAA